MIGNYLLEICYIVASVFFIFGLKMLSHPESARRGNIIAAIGMVLAIIFTILFHKKDGQPIGNLGFSCPGYRHDHWLGYSTKG